MFTEDLINNDPFNRNLSPLEESKRKAAYTACLDIQDGMWLGLGTGSTAFYVVERVAMLSSSGMDLKCVSSSEKTKKLANERGLKIYSLEEAAPSLDLYLDGADEYDGNFNVIKGGGAALFREKVVAKMAKKVYWVMDETKLSPRLGSYPLPIEVANFALVPVMRYLDSLDLKPSLRLNKSKKENTMRENLEALSNHLKNGDTVLITDNGNYILDCYGVLNSKAFASLEDLALMLDLRVGIFEHGLFLNMCKKVFVAKTSGEIIVQENNK